MSDKAVEVIAEALAGKKHANLAADDATAVIAALKAAGMVVVDGLTDEWGQPWPTFTVVISEHTARRLRRARERVVSRLVGPWREVSRDE